MEKANFNVKIVGLIFDTAKRQVLIGKNKGDEYYSFVEGSLRYDEELDKSLKRIIKEKTGYVVHNLGAIYAENMLKEKDKLKIHFLCENANGEEILGENVEKLIWVKPSEVEEKIGGKLPPRLHEYLMNLE